MKKKKILVYGASGFIGRNLFETLSKRKDFEVFGTYRTNRFSANKRLFRVDLTRKKETVAAAKGMDIVIHAAAITAGVKDVVSRPYIFVTDNAVINAHALQAAYDNGVAHFIFLSCSVMYQPDTRKPVKESDFDMREELHGNYFGPGWTKVYAEKLCEFYSRLGKTKFTVIRHSNIYGPYDKYDLERSHVFGATIAKVLAARDEVFVWGAGREERDFLHVDDLVRFVECSFSAVRPPFDLVNVGIGKPVSVRTLVRKAITASGKSLAIRYDVSKPTIPTRLFLDIAKARKEYGWTPRISVDEGIASTIAWYRKAFPKKP